MFTKTIAFFISSFFLVNGMEKEVPVDYSHYIFPFDLPMDMKREIAKTIDQAINQENPEISGQMIRDLQLTSKNFKNAIDNNIEKIITSLAQKKKISKTLAALYIGNKAALDYYEKNKDKDPLELEQLMQYYTGSKQSHAILDKIHMTRSIAITKYIQPLIKPLIIDNQEFTRDLTPKILTIKKKLPDGSNISFFTSNIPGVLVVLMNYEHSILGIGHDTNDKKIIKVDLAGKLDPLFGNNGLVTIRLPRNGDFFMFAVIQANKNIVLCYYHNMSKTLSVVLLSPQGKILDIYEQKK